MFAIMKVRLFIRKGRGLNFPLFPLSLASGYCYIGQNEEDYFPRGIHFHLLLVKSNEQKETFTGGKTLH